MAGSAFPLGGSQSNSQSHNNNSGTSAGGLRAGAPPSLLRPDPTTAPLLGQEPAYSDSSEDDNAQEKNNSHNNLMPLDPGSKGPSTLSYTMPNDPLHEYSANTAVTPLLRPTKPAGEEGSGSDTIDGRQSTGVMNSHTPSGLASPNLSKLRHDENSRSSVAYAGGTVSSSHWGQSAEKTVPRSFSTFSAGFDAMDHDGPHEEILNASLSPTSSNASSATEPRSASDNDGAELIPASEAAPSNWRKGPLNFNTTFMVLLGIRNLAAACRRFMRDITLISSERFFILPFVEQNRRMLHRRINYLWLIVAIIDIILNTYRLSRPGWTKYVNARQEVRYYCGCKGNENPNDTVWYANGFVVRRKLDLFFPALDLDFGAPYASTINFFEAADPVHMQPACSRCGCLYRETSSYRSQHLPEEQKPGWVQLYDAAAREHNVTTHNAASRTTSTTVGKVRGPAGAAVGAAAIDTNGGGRSQRTVRFLTYSALDATSIQLRVVTPCPSQPAVLPVGPAAVHRGAVPRVQVLFWELRVQRERRPAGAYLVARWWSGRTGERGGRPHARRTERTEINATYINKKN
ncbi:hypothetical protein AGDE_15471 [Angomonas deanei]|uniref:Uncharacterized protein n=1 Tax=Angomonas deanei TaxID=59799 RepID=A0A7G2CWI7_9TRYP|nr:hypothetical protein AGDE_15471 [Angomonas deanei]CAD2222612.1 hypothetical protein, conserved [Angomonas deanei]|eukprot:EPY19025.1 hypothetical protein AGDE_15471 [Angomonas deanei]